MDSHVDQSPSTHPNLSLNRNEKLLIGSSSNHQPQIMFNNRGTASDHKLKGVMGATEPMTLLQPTAANMLPTFTVQQRQNQQSLNQMLTDFMAKPVDSYTALLMEDDNDTDDFNKIITKHIEEMKRQVPEMMWKNYTEMLRAAEEKTAQKLSEKDMQLKQMMVQNAELQKEVVQFSREVKNSEARIRYLETSLVNARAQHEQVDGRTYQNPNPTHGVQPMMIVCVTCYKNQSNMVMWPCRHVALCKTCDTNERVCPICRATKMMSIELGLPALPLV